MKRTDVIDEDGNEMVAPDPTSDVGRIIYLLEYGRARGFRIGPVVQVGDAIVQVRDLRQPAAKDEDDKTKPVVQEPTIWQQAGYDGPDQD